VANLETQHLAVVEEIRTRVKDTWSPTKIHVDDSLLRQSEYPYAIVMLNGFTVDSSVTPCADHYNATYAVVGIFQSEPDTIMEDESVRLYDQMRIALLADKTFAEYGFKLEVTTPVFDLSGAYGENTYEVGLMFGMVLEVDRE
jgi:hypothetical protein